MGLIEPGRQIPGTAEDVYYTGVPINGTSEVETLTVTGTPTGGTLALSFNGIVTAPIAYDANAAAVQAALNALPYSGNPFTCTGGALPGTPVVITFGGILGSKAISSAIVADGSLLTGGATPAAAVAVTTPGVEATRRGALKGAIINNGTDGKAYENQGTPDNPSWVKIGLDT